jgi:uncharacterized membrane protein
MSQAVLPSAAPPPASAAAPTVRPRLDAVDWLRGLVMVVMALDHVRDFWGDVTFDAIDPHQTTLRHFFTRWVTHFCAPTFIFLTGAGVYLAAARGRTKTQLVGFLFTRGLWLILLEFTVLRLCWLWGDLTYEFMPGGVLWAIGASLVLMAPLILLPDWLITLLGLALILGHNAFDGVKGESFGSWSWVWYILHDQGPIRILAPDPATGFKGVTFFPAYKVVPWVGVVMVGYGFGRVLLFDPARRLRWLVGLGLGLCVAFIAVRGLNAYGDPKPWLHEPDAQVLAKLAEPPPAGTPPRTAWPPLSPREFDALSFLNCEKYPPSLDYLLMTLGPALLLLAAAFAVPPGPLGRILITFGRVPLFYYLLHLPLIFAAAYLAYLVGHWQGAYGSLESFLRAGGLRLPLWQVYLVWLAVVVILYFPCRWYADLKRRSRSVWLSYL